MSVRNLPLSLSVALTTAVVAATCCAAAHAGCCEITTGRPASIFLSHEPIEFVIRSDAPLQDVAWTVSDHHGQRRAGGVVPLGGGTPGTLRVRERPGVGFYRLELAFASGDRAEDVFCVVPPPDECRGDGGLFGVGGMPADSTQWDILARMGVRHVRAEFPWPEVERAEGEYDLTWVEEFADQAERRGIALTVLTGHTPRHYGQRPADAEGRVARAWYTWQPERTIEWYRFLDTMARRLVTRRLPPDPAHPTDTLPRGGRPFVVAWEVWSEADQNFYYGDWDRYLDMLRIAWCTIRAHRRVPVVYGSCGHMTQMNYTFAAGCGDYFDRVAYHPHGGDPDYELMHWFRNMPQAMLAHGAPRETAFTECDFHGPDAEREPGFILRLYATLKSWRQQHYVRSGCTGGVITGGDSYYALIRRDGDRYRPTPACVAFALARWLLDGAHYIGPLDAPDGARLELFIRRGVPLVVGWSEDARRRVSLRVAPSARLIDCMGGSGELAGPDAAIDLSPDAVAVTNVSMRCVRQAALAATERRLTTELGHESPHNSSYVDPLEVDAAACIAPDFPSRVRDAVRRACDRFEARSSHGAAAFFEAQRVVGAGMLDAALDARRAGELRPLHTNTIWRLAQYVEELGDIADGLGERWRRMNNVTPGDLAKTREKVRAIRSRVSAAHGGAECPFADRLLDRALEQLDIVTAGGGHNRGAWWAATLEARAAHALTGVEEPLLRRAFAVALFPTARPMTKGKLVAPDSAQMLEARVYNFLPHEISGILCLEMPSQWSCSRPRADFSAPPGGPNGIVALPYGVPEEPRPWVQKTVYRPWGDFKVDIPEPLQTNERLTVSLRADRRPAADVCYRTFVGSYPSQATEVADGEMTVGLPGTSPAGGAVQVFAGLDADLRPHRP